MPRSGWSRREFNPPPAGPDDRTIYDHLIKTAPPSTLVRENGDPAEGEKLAAHIVEETYLNAYVAHAPMETHSAVASVRRRQMHHMGEHAVAVPGEAIGGGGAGYFAG